MLGWILYGFAVQIFGATINTSSDHGPVIFAPRRFAGAQRVGWDAGSSPLTNSDIGLDHSMDFPGAKQNTVMFSNLPKQPASMDFQNLNQGAFHPASNTQGVSKTQAATVERPIASATTPVFFSVDEFLVSLRRQADPLVQQVQRAQQQHLLPHQALEQLLREQHFQLQQNRGTQGSRIESASPSTAQVSTLLQQHPAAESNDQNQDRLLLRYQPVVIPSEPSRRLHPTDVSNLEDVQLISNNSFSVAEILMTPQFHCEGNDLYFCNEHNDCDIQATCIHGCATVVGRGAFCRIVQGNRTSPTETQEVSEQPKLHIKLEAFNTSEGLHQSRLVKPENSSHVSQGGSATGNPTIQCRSLGEIGLDWHGSGVYCIDQALYDCNQKRECTIKTFCSNGCVLGRAVCNAVNVKSAVDPGRKFGRASKSGGASGGLGYCDSTAPEPQKCPGGIMCSPTLLDCITKGPQKCICGSKPVDQPEKH